MRNLPRRLVSWGCPTAACLVSALCLLLVGCAGRSPDDGRGNSGAATEQRIGPEHPNVLLIVLDTLRADCLGCYGERRRGLTPNMDALARDGIVFENHIVAAPWTVPSHASLFTSLYPSTHGMTQSFKEIMGPLVYGAQVRKLPEVWVTLAEALRDSGYATGAFTGGHTLDPRLGFIQGFQYYDTSMYKLNPTNMSAMYRWIRRHAQAPFFLFWHHFEVHDPYLCTDFLPETLPAKTAAEVREHLEELKRSVESLTPGINRHRLNNEELQDFLRQHGAYTPAVCRALYEGGVRSADVWLGALIKTLRDARLYDQSLIVLTSDHGEEFADHYEDKFFGGHGHSLYDEVIRTPLIIKLPRQHHAGVRVKEVVRNIDVMPTILDLLQIDQAALQMQGSSMRPLWEEEGFTDDRLAVSEALFDLDEKKSVRTRQYKFVFSIPPRVVSEKGRAYMPERAARLELYDVLADPHERVNLLETDDGDKYARLIQSMEEYLRQAIARPGWPVETTTLEQETLEALRAMGYIENERSRPGED